MDGKRFDTIARGMTAGESRRRVLLGVLGGAASALTGVSLLATKGKGRGKGKGKGKNKGKRRGTTKVQLCHHSDETQGYELIKVGSPAVKGHEHHGDTVCEPGPCQIGPATGCDEDGSCIFASTPEGSECEVGGETGICGGGECEL